MWNTEYRAETSAAPMAVWSALRDLHSGTAGLVGRSAECDYPADVSALPVVTSARIDSTR